MVKILAQITDDASMRPLRKYLLGTAVVFAIGGAIAFYAIMSKLGQAMIFIQNNKEMFFNLAVEFDNCLLEQPTKLCIEKLGARNLQNESMINTLTILEKTVKAKLGKRLSAKLDEDSIYFKTSNDESGDFLRVTFTLKADYEKDHGATQSYNLISYKNYKDGKFLFEGITYTSDELLK